MVHHLHGAGMIEEALELLIDPDWISRSLAAKGTAWELVRDYDRVLVKATSEGISGSLPTKSRVTDCNDWTEEAALDALSIEEAVAFLQSRARCSDERGAQTLAEALGRLPLAMEHAAALCRLTQMQFLDYAVKASNLDITAPSDTSYPNVAATFGLAMAEAAKQCPAAEALIAYLAHCAPERIPIALAQGAIDDEGEFLAAITVLSELSLVKNSLHEDGTAAVSIHPVVMAIARAHSEAKGTARHAVERLIDRLMAIYPQDEIILENPRCWSVCAPLTSHLLDPLNVDSAGILKFAEWSSLLNRAGNYFFARGYHAQAMPLFRRALAICENYLGGGHVHTATSLHYLARLLHAEDDLAGARPLFERAQAIREEALGLQHPDTAKNLSNLAYLLQAQGEVAEARALFERAYASIENLLGPDHCDTATILNDFAIVYEAEGDLVGARALYESALTIFENVPENESSVAVCAQNLAMLLHKQGELSAAWPLYRRALAIDEKLLGPEHPQTAADLHNFARLLQDQGELTAARQLLQRALAVREKVLGPEHPNTNRVRYRLACVLLATNQATEALILGETALAAHENALGRNHPWTADSASVTAKALDGLRRSKEARALRARYAVNVSGATISFNHRAESVSVPSNDDTPRRGPAKPTGQRWSHLSNDSMLGAALSQAPISENLNRTLIRAQSIAEEQSHGVGTPEHLLLALTDDPDAALVMEACNVDLDKLRLILSSSLSSQPAEANGATPSLGNRLKAILQRVIVRFQEIGKGQEINGAHVLVEMFESKSTKPVAELLRGQGMSRLDALSYVSQGKSEAVPTPDDDEPPIAAAMLDVKLLNDDYTPMEFVVEVLRRVFDQDSKTATATMLLIHNNGVATCGVYPSDIAKAKAAQVMELARAHEHPLYCITAAVRLEAPPLRENASPLLPSTTLPRNPDAGSSEGKLAVQGAEWPLASSTVPRAASIFVSYATGDGASFATALRRELEAHGFAVWQDIAALEGGRDWWAQIEERLKSEDLQHLVLVLTPLTLTRPVIRDEIHLAREQGKTVIPVRGPGLDLSSAKLPRHIGQVMDLAIPEHKATFLRMLKGPSLQKPVPMMVPEPPGDYVPRLAEIERLKAKLLAADTKAVVSITAALRGTTGYGKTTLARALAYDYDVRDAYFDGTLFVELGQNGRARVIPLISDIIAKIDGKRSTFHTIEGARTALGEALGNRHFLLIIDDVWHRADLAPFLHGGPNTSRLITTRFAGELPDDVVQERVEGMTGGADGEAWQLLASGLPEHEVTACKTALIALADRRHNWPMALRLTNGFLRTRIGVLKHALRAPSGPAARVPAPLDLALKAAMEWLNKKGGRALDKERLKRPIDEQESYEYRHESIENAIELNLSLLDTDKRTRFEELAVFPDDVNVPVALAALLWTETGDLDRFDAERLLEAFDDASLLDNLDFPRGTFRFHDSVREYLHDKAGKDGLAAWHKCLIRSIDDIRQAGDKPTAETEYFYRYLPYHLAEAGDRETLNALLLDPAWLKAKFAATNSLQIVIADYDQYSQGRMQNLIGRTLRLIIGICARDPHQLIQQLLSRLMACDDPAAPKFLGEARRHLSLPAILMQRPSLATFNAEVGRLEGHTGLVNALVMLPDGRLASGSSDFTIRLWDLQLYNEVARLKNDRWIDALAVLPNNRFAFGSCIDSTVYLLDLKAGAEIGRLPGHGKGVMVLDVLPDGRLVSGSGDGKIRLWDIDTAAEIARLDGHTREVNALAVLPDGRLASASEDKTIRLWDLTTCAEVARLESHSPGVRALAVLPDGRLASASEDKTIRLWDLTTCTEVARLTGHSDEVTALAVLPNGCLASASEDKTIRLWDLEACTEVVRLTGHSDEVTALAVLPDGRLASGSGHGDTTIRLWDPDLAISAENLGFWGDGTSVWPLAVLPDGRVASGSADGTVKLWDPKTGAESSRLVAHFKRVSALTVLPSGQLASGSFDGMIRIWDVKTGAEVCRLHGHARTVPRWDAESGAEIGRMRDGTSSEVCALVTLPDGRLASGYDDTSIWLWDIKSGAEAGRLRGGSWGSVYALAVLPDGHLASGQQDGSIRFWDLNSGAEVATLTGHQRDITALAVLPDGRLASGSHDGTIKLWDLKTGTEICRIKDHDGAVRALAVLPDGRLASGSEDKTIRLWDFKSAVDTHREIARLEVDAIVLGVATLSNNRVVASDLLGRLHWLEIVE